jgi:hypothetical protein
MSDCNLIRTLILVSSIRVHITEHIAEAKILITEHMIKLGMNSE